MLHRVDSAKETEITVMQMVLSLQSLETAFLTIIKR